MAGGGDLGFYIGSYTSDANATAFLTSRGYTQALGYEYWDSVNSQLKKWDGTGWGVITGAGATSPWRTTAGAIHPATPGTDDVAVAAAAMAGTERFRVNAASLMDKADAGADPVLTVQASASHPVAQPVLMIDQDLTTMTAAGLLIDSEVGASGAPLIELQPLNTNTRGDIAFGATRTGDPAGIATTGDLWYNSTAAAFKYYDGIAVQTISVGGTSPWSEAGAPSVLYPSSYATDDVVVAANTMVGTERFRVAGDSRFDSGSVSMGGVAPSSTTVLNIEDDLSDSLATLGEYIKLAFDGVGTKTSWTGLGVEAGQVSTGTVTDSVGVSAQLTVSTACTYGTFFGYRSWPNLNDASATLTDYYAYWIGNTGGTGTITNCYGLYVNDMGLNSTTVYGVYIADQTGTTTYGIYQAGTDQNYFAGRIGVNTASPSSSRWIDVQETDATASREGVRAEFNKTAAGGKPFWRSFVSEGAMTAGSAGSLEHFRAFPFDIDTGPVTSTYGARIAQPEVAAAVVLTDAFGIRIESPNNSGTITSIYGLYIEQQDIGTVTNPAYGIYQADSGDVNYFAGNVGIGGAPKSDTQLSALSTESSGTPAGILTQYNHTTGAITSWTGVDSYLNTDAPDAADLTNVYSYRSRVDMADSSDITSNAFGFHHIINVGTANNAIATAFGVQLESPTGSGTITTAYGVAIQDQGLSSTTAYGVYIADQTATTAYGIYQLGSDDRNYFAGQVNVNRTTFSSSTYVDVLDDEETGIRACYQARLEKNGAGVKAQYDGFSSDASVALNSATLVRGFYSKVATNGGDITDAAGFVSQFDVTGSDTVGESRGLWCLNSTGGATVTTAYGIDIEDQGVNSTTTYGIYLRDQTGTTTYGIYQAGTDDPNYFAGNVGVGALPVATTTARVQNSGATGSLIGVDVTFNHNSGAITSWTGVESEISSSGADVDDITLAYGCRSRVSLSNSVDIGTYYGFHSSLSLSAATNVITTGYAFFADAPGGSGSITNAYGLYILGQGGTTLSYGIYQSGASDQNYFAGHLGVGRLPTTTDLVVAEENSSSVTAFHAELDTTTNISTFYGFQTDIDVNSGDLLGLFHGVRIDVPTGAGSIDNAIGIMVRDLGGGPTINTESYAIYIEDQTKHASSTPFAIYQAGSNDDNYFAGAVGIKDSTPSYALDVNGDVNVQTGSVYRHNGSAGLSGTYTFGGGTTGDIATMTFAGGILTAVTTVP